MRASRIWSGAASTSSIIGQVIADSGIFARRVQQEPACPALVPELT